MSDNELRRNEHETIRATIHGSPAESWDGIDTAEVYWVLTASPRELREVVISKDDSDDDVTVVETGGGEDPAVITVDLDDEETGSLDADVYYQDILIRDNTGRVSGARLDPHRLNVRRSPAEAVLGGD